MHSIIVFFHHKTLTFLCCNYKIRAELPFLIGTSVARGFLGSWAINNWEQTEWCPCWAYCNGVPPCLSSASLSLSSLSKWATQSACPVAAAQWRGVLSHKNKLCYRHFIFWEVANVFKDGLINRLVPRKHRLSLPSAKVQSVFLDAILLSAKWS